MSLFDLREFHQDVLEKVYGDVMNGRLGIHMRLVGCFWAVDGIEKTFNSFYDFVCSYRVPVKTTWEPRRAGSCWGVKFYGADMKDCYTKN